MDTEADLYARYAGLRDAGPVHLVRQPDGTAVWVVLPYGEARAALADPRLAKDPDVAGDALPPSLARVYRGSGQGLGGNMLTLDPPDHTRLRRLPGLALAVPREQLRWRPSTFVRGLRALPVRFTPARGDAGTA
jgi:cytochrome P450